MLRIMENQKNKYNQNHRGENGNYNEIINGDYIQGDSNKIINITEIIRETSDKNINLDKLREWKDKEHPPRKFVDFFPDQWANHEVRIILESHGLGIQCDDKDIGNFRVFVIDVELNEIVYMEGVNHHKTEKLDIFFNRKYNIKEGKYNRKYLSDEILLNIFHLARCWREHKRTKEKCFANDYEYYHNKVISELNNSASEL